MSDSRDDTPTTHIRSGPHRAHITEESLKRWNLSRDVVAAVLLVIALALPWNLYFGVGIPDSRLELFVAVPAVTLLSLISIACSWRFKHVQPGRLRATLNVPYFLLVLGFVLFDVIQTVRDGGSANVPGGLGPGAWIGTAGALLSAQPPITNTPVDTDRFRGWLLTARVVGYAAIVLAALAVVFNLFWRIKSALPTDSGFGKQSFAIIVTAVVYGLVALAAVVVASWWVLQRSRASRLAMVALGVSTLVAGPIVWLLPIGREIDAFHGIAQNTSTAGVGFEGFLAWAAAAAIVAPLTLLRTATSEHVNDNMWRQAARKGLLLIALWSAASVLMRITDLAISVILNLPSPPYDSAAMAAFDLVTAVLAAWLHVNLTNRSLPVPVISSLCGVLFVFSVSRIVIGIALAPRFAGRPAALNNPVYGNDLAQQITSTFDVALSALTLCILVVTIITGKIQQRQPHVAAQPSRSASPQDAETTRLTAGGAPAPASAPAPANAPAPRIFRPAERPPTAPSAPKIYRGPQEPTGGGRHR